MNCRLLFLLIVCWPLSVSAGESAPAASLPNPTAERLPRWRGFNLLEKFHKDWNNHPFVEQDFALIHQFGFNFVRLPMDYRTWIEDGDWEKFHEPTLRQIDQAVAYGEKYGVHVMLNFHRAPGYTVASPPEAKSLWTDPQAQRVCALHWATFARRYKGIPNSRLSFNLFNEPAEIDPKAYVATVRQIVAAIRREDPDRLIVSDGLKWGTRPVLELAELKIAQATRGYSPMEISHYKAGWMQGADRLPVPTWPIVTAPGMLYGSGKEDLQQPLSIQGPFPKESRLRIRVGVVSTRAHLFVEADVKVVFEKDFVCGPGEGEWKTAQYRPEWKVYQNVYDRDYFVPIPAAARQLRIRVAEGDWMSLGELAVVAGGQETVIRLRDAWGEKTPRLALERTELGWTFSGGERLDRQWLQTTMVQPWKEAQAKGIGVMVGECGAFNQTPHPVFLAWFEDNLKNWKEAGWGWALWNFRGSFGVLDSERPDVVYEDLAGHKLDRKLLELLQRY